MKFADLNETLYRELQDPEFAQAYLEEALDDSVGEFLIALFKLVQAQGGVNRCAQGSGITREALYKMLSGKGNPSLRSVETILKTYGLSLNVRSEIPTEPAGASASDGESVSLPPLLREELDRLAAEQNITRDELARMILVSGVTAMQAGRSILAASR